MKQDYRKDAHIFKALSDEKRLMILELLQCGETCACVLMEKMNIAQSALSYHMKILCESDLVNARQDGKWIHYSIHKEGCRYASKRILQISECSDTKKSCC